MSTDAIAQLARMAAFQQVFGLEKAAALPIGKWLGRGLLGAGGLLAAKDVYKGLGGGWGGNTEGNLGWHHQLTKGQDYNAPMRGWFSPTAWGRTLTSPLKSLVAPFAGNGPTAIQGAPSYAGGKWTTNKANPAQQTYEGGQLTRSQTFAPQIEGKYKQLQAARGALDQMQTAQQAKIKALEGQREDIAPKLWRAKMDTARNTYDAGNYGGGWFGTNAAGRRRQIGDLESELQQVGRLPPETPAMGGVPFIAGGPSATTPTPMTSYSGNDLLYGY